MSCSSSGCSPGHGSCSPLVLNEDVSALGSALQARSSWQTRGRRGVSAPCRACPGPEGQLLLKQSDCGKAWVTSEGPVCSDGRRGTRVTGGLLSMARVIGSHERSVGEGVERVSSHPWCHHHQQRPTQGGWAVARPLCHGQGAVLCRLCGGGGHSHL